MTGLTTWIVVDIETAADPSAEAYLTEPEPDRRLRDQDKIAADLAAKRARQTEQSAKDPYAGRIVALGVRASWDTEPRVWNCEDTDGERGALEHLAEEIQAIYPAPVIGYCLLGFDWPFLVTRARLLGVSWPARDTRKYGNHDLLDVWAAMTFDGIIQTGVVSRSLQTMARRFGITVDDDIDGSQIPALVAAGHWDAVRAHCASDVRLTVALARRIGLVTTPAEVLTYDV